MHHFPEADDDLLIAARAEAAANIYVESRLAGDEVYISSEKAIARLLDGFEISPYDFVSGIRRRIFGSYFLDERSIEFWTYTLLEELQQEFKRCGTERRISQHQRRCDSKAGNLRSDCRIFRRIWPLTDYRPCATTLRLSGFVLKLGVAGRTAQTPRRAEILHKVCRVRRVEVYLNDANELADAAKWSKSDIELFAPTVELRRLIHDYSHDDKEFNRYMESLKASTLTASIPTTAL